MGNKRLAAGDSSTPTLLAAFSLPNKLDTSKRSPSRKGPLLLQTETHSRQSYSPNIHDFLQANFNFF